MQKGYRGRETRNGSQKTQLGIGNQETENGITDFIFSDSRFPIPGYCQKKNASQGGIHINLIEDYYTNIRIGSSRNDLSV